MDGGRDWNALQSWEEGESFNVTRGRKDRRGQQGTDIAVRSESSGSRLVGVTPKLPSGVPPKTTKPQHRPVALLRVRPPLTKLNSLLHHQVNCSPLNHPTTNQSIPFNMPVNSNIRLSTAPSNVKPRQLSHLHSQLAQLQAHLSDTENLLRVTCIQAEHIRDLGAIHGGL